MFGICNWVQVLSFKFSVRPSRAWRGIFNGKPGSGQVGNLDRVKWETWIGSGGKPGSGQEGNLDGSSAAQRLGFLVGSSLLTHGVEEFLVGGGSTYFIEEELHRVDYVEWVEELAQYPHTFEFGVAEE